MKDFAGDTLLFTDHYSARCFRANLHENPEDSSAKLHEMQFLCIAKCVAVNGVNSNGDRVRQM